MASIMLLSTWFAGVAAHGRMTSPTNRVGGTLEVACRPGDGCAMGSGFAHPKDNMCGYMSRPTKGTSQTLGTHQPPTNCDPKYLTSSAKYMKDGRGGCKTKGQAYQNMPWRSPGTAQVYSPCGIDEGYPAGTKKGINLAQNSPTTWFRGQSHAVAFSINVNHGGGYAYRLCPKSQTLSEACFQANHLAFSSPQHTIKWTDGHQEKIDALHLKVGTHPSGSMWAVVPIPTDQMLKNGAKSPCKTRVCQGIEGTIPHKTQESQWKFSVMDHVMVPSNFPKGGAVLSWRWDNEIQDQVWSNCADIIVTDGSLELESNETLSFTV